MTLEITGSKRVVRAGITRARFQRQTTNCFNGSPPSPTIFSSGTTSPGTISVASCLVEAGLDHPPCDGSSRSDGARNPVPCQPRKKQQLKASLLGACVDPRIRNGDLLEIPLVNPWSLGIMAYHPGTQQTQFSEVIPPYAPLPLTATKTFRTRRAGPCYRT
ncbi:MAG: hypothetical protein R3B96_24495 [Pirellulaceae bacterium]